MADTTTTNLGLTKPEVGASADTWGTKLNTDLDLVDALFAAAGNGTSVGLNVGAGKTIAVAGTLNVTGTVSGGIIAPLASPTFTGTVTLPSTTSVGNVSSTELGYLDGVTSAIQTQLDAKSPLASPTFTGTVTTATADLLGSVRSNVTTVSASAIDCSAGNYFTKTASGALTWTFTNVPSSRAFSLLLELTNGGTGTQTWPAAVKWPGGTAPTLTTSGVDVLGFITDDGGTNWRGVALMVDSK
jgi:hypothetical protein